MLFALDICVNKKAPPTHSLNPRSISKTSPSIFLIIAQPPLKSANCSYPLPPYSAIPPCILFFFL